MGDISLKFLFMAKSVTGLFCMMKVFFLLCLFFSASVQADTPWQTQSSHYLAQLLKSNPEHLLELNEPAVAVFYRERKYKPLWLDAEGRLNRSYDLLQVIIHAEDEGLEPSDYYLDEIRKYWDSKTLKESIYLDLILTAAFYRYSNHVYSGRFDPHELDVDWHIQNRPLDVSSLFTDMDRKESITQILKELPPQHSGYQLLKKQLRRFRELKQQGGWQRFKPGPTLELGVHHQQVLQLRQRLEITGDLLEYSLRDIDVFDHALAEAVKRYQVRHGLKVDGRVGGETRRSLNITVDARVRQIRINMERWRWMQRQLGERYLMVNMTGFELYIMENGSAVLVMPVIIGKSYRATPSFSGQISTMEYNPYWTIPTKMTVEDFIPRQINDPAFFAKKSIKLYRGLGSNTQEIDPQTVNWNQLDKNRFPYWLRQDPGPKNPMGRIKFLFSNPYAIYLHGTPDKHLFDRIVRTFSAGCIRVKDPVQLAAYLLNDGNQQMEEEILANIHLGTNQEVSLPIVVPIYLVYWTAWVDMNGSVNFRNDVYGRDTPLNRAFGR
jgi:murein L,D-transpeptidase YcbB/YkuD